jgi:hypothetical protein
MDPKEKDAPLVADEGVNDPIRELAEDAEPTGPEGEPGKDMDRDEEEKPPDVGGG